MAKITQDPSKDPSNKPVTMVRQQFGHLALNPFKNIDNVIGEDPDEWGCARRNGCVIGDEMNEGY